MKRACFAVAIIAILPFLAACGGSGGGSGKPIDPPKPLYTVGGTVSGLEADHRLILQNNSENPITRRVNGQFSFATALADGGAYNVAVLLKPLRQACTVANGSGTVKSANVTDILVTCTDKTGGVTLSGEIAVPQGVVTDGSVNDPKDKYKSNEDPWAPQELPNPISVGGYVNRRFAGSIGRSWRDGNTDDFYKVRLKKDDVITLAIGELDTRSNRLDLWLWDNEGNYVDTSEGYGPYKVLFAPSDGTYIVNVYASSGASNYILMIGADMTAAEIAAADMGILSTQHEMVPDQIIVRFKDDVKTAASTSGTVTQYTADMGMTAIAGSPEREMLFSIDDLKVQSFADETDCAFQKSNECLIVNNPEKARLRNTFLAINELRNRPDILSADPNYIVRSYNTTPPVNDPYYGHQWNLPMINAPEAWNEIEGGSEVIVAVVDSGVLMGHPDLNGRLTNTGYNFVSDNGMGPNPNDPGDNEPGTGRSSFHGTHVAGIIAAGTNNNIGVAGVTGTMNIKIMPVRVIGAGGTGTIYNMLQGIRYAAGLSNDSGTILEKEKRADIINLSLGSSACPDSDQRLINDILKEGIIVIAAAGNENTSIPSYPASYDGVISVSAVTKNKTRACYSNYGSRIAVAAPGGNSQRCGAGVVKEDSIYSAGGDDSTNTVVFEYNYKAGTSMAAPHVSGVAALMKAVYPGMSPDEFDALLAVGRITDDIGAAGKDEYYGYGLINAKKAIEAAQNLAAGGSITGIGVNPRTINLGVYGSQATITVSKIGTGVISFNDIRSSVNAGWLTVTRNPVVGGESVDYSVNVNRSSSSLHADGVYTAIVTFTDPVSGATASAGITVQVHSAAISYDVGYHYVVLFKVKNDNTIDENAVDQYEVKTTDGYYYYVFYNVPPGRYMIAAGTDRNNDYSIEDWGEVFGAYPTVDQIDVIDVTNKDISDLNFTTNLRYPLRYPQAETTSSSDDNPVAEPPAIKRLR